MSISPLELIDAHPWKRVAFTTYAVSLAFFEAVVLDRMVRGGASQAVILSDVHGVKAALSEQGAQRVGKDYEVEPVSVDGGVFHPKVTVLADGDECHLLVGSGNLTFNGWGGNCEMLEHLHAGFAPDALADAAVFFDRLANAERVRHAAASHCAAIAADLRRAVTGKAASGTIRFIHTLDTAIEDQIAQFADEFGGAKRLTAMAPYYDGAAGIDSLAGKLGLTEVFVHAHKHGCVDGLGAQNWPRGGRSRVTALCLDLFEKKDARRLHAKAFEILCKRGRIVVSGSANGTTAALGPGRNVEACVVRLQRARKEGWRSKPAEPLTQVPASDEEPDNDVQRSGVLRATLDGDQLAGKVLTPRMTGLASVFLVTGTGPELLAKTILSTEGAFTTSASFLEERSWTGGRLVIRVEDSRGRVAEGFVSVLSVGEITKRAGLLGRRLFALLAGTETPADVAAIMSWFHEDPGRLASAAPVAIAAGAGGPKAAPEDTLIPVDALSPEYTAGAIAVMAHSHSSERSWARFMDNIFAVFRSARTPFEQTAAGGGGDDHSDDDTEESPPDGSVERAYDSTVERSLVVFQKLFDLLTAPGSPPRHTLMAFDLTQYVCARLRPDAAEARRWLEVLIRNLVTTDIPQERHPDVAAAVLVLVSMEAEPSLPACRWARHCLLRLHVGLDDPPPEPERVAGFASVLSQRVPFGQVWPQLKAIRTLPEQVRAYLKALEARSPAEEGYPSLRIEAAAEWPVLEGAFTSEKARLRLAPTPRNTGACPRCFITLPSAEAARLQSVGIASAKGCCGRVVIWAGE